MKRSSLLFVMIAATACELVYLRASWQDLNASPRNFAMWLNVFWLLVPFIFIVFGGLLSDRSWIKSAYIVGASVATGIVAGLLSWWILFLVESQPEQLMTKITKSMPNYHAPINYFAFVPVANLVLLLAALGTWIWRRKEMRALNIWQGVGAGFLYWVLLLAFFRSLG
jgi:uncharacterized membrane protein (DUF485 family)